jgi:hypothetical protein
LSDVTDVVRSIFELPATACSILRVTSSSTFSDAMPGQGQIATATRTGMSGSLRLGMLA